MLRPSTAPAPAPASKPARLRVASSSTTSPTAASLRFPKISPTSSPTKSTYRSSLDIPSKNDLPKEPISSGRISPVLTSPVRRRAPPSPQARNESLRQVAELRPVERKSPLPSPKDERPTFTPPEVSKQPDARSPSPDRPYQGVSKLIDQWQKKSEESKVPYAVYKSGSRFKRPGIAAGGSKDS